MLQTVKPGRVLALKLVLIDQGVRLGHAVNGFNSEPTQMTEHWVHKTDSGVNPVCVLLAWLFWGGFQTITTSEGRKLRPQNASLVLK